MTGQWPKEIFVYGTLLPGEANFHQIATMVAGREGATEPAAASSISR